MQVPAKTAEPEVSWTKPQVCGTEGLLCICDNPLDMMLKLDAMYGAASAAASSSMMHSTSTSQGAWLDPPIPMERSFVAIVGVRWCTLTSANLLLGVLNALRDTEANPPYLGHSGLFIVRKRAGCQICLTQLGMQLMGFLAQGRHNRAFISGEDCLELWLEVEAGDEVGEAGEAVAEGGLMVKVMAAMNPGRSLKNGQKWVGMDYALC